MIEILVEHNPSPMKLEVLGVDDWQVVTETAGSLSREYAETETFYVDEGEAEIMASNGHKVSVGPGDLVTILPASRCTWTITREIVRYYRTG